MSSLPATPPPASWQRVAQHSLAPMSTPAVKQSCQDAKHSLTAQVDIMFGKVRKLKDKRVLAVFLEDMKMVKGIISKWDARVDAMLSDQRSGKENQGHVSFQTTLTEILKGALPPGAPAEAPSDGNERRNGTEPTQVAKAQQTERSRRQKKQKQATQRQTPASPMPDCHRQGDPKIEEEHSKGRLANLRPSATVTLDLGPTPPLEAPAANHADTAAKPDQSPQMCSNNTGSASTLPPSGNSHQDKQLERTRSLGGAAATEGPSLGRAYSFKEAATAKQQGDTAGSELNLERFPPSFRTGAAAEELTAVWREFILAEARAQQRCEQGSGNSNARRRRVALTVDHLSQRLEHISSERLSLLLEVLQSRRFLISRRGMGPAGTQILWERAWVWEK